MNKGDENTRRVTVTLPESLIEALDGAVSDAPDYLSLSRSELVSYAAEEGVEQWSGDVEQLVPDSLLARYRTKRETERIKAEHYVIDKREGWRGRVKSYLNARLAGEEPYHPQGVGLLAEGYRDELEMLDRLAPESSRSVADDLEWLDGQIDAYRDAWEAKQVLPSDRPFEGVEDGVSTGRDLLSLRGRFGEVVDAIEARAESNAYDPDAIVRALAAEYGVGEESIEVVLDTLLPDGVDYRQALKDLEESPIESILPEGVVDDVESREISGEVVIDDSRDMIEGDMASRTLQVRAEELPGPESEIDAERVEEVVSEEIRADGGDD